MIAALLLLALGAQEPETVTLELSLSGPNCEGCKQDIERGLRRVGGFVSAAAVVDTAKKTAAVTLKLRQNEPIHRKTIEKALRQFGLTRVGVTLKGELTDTAGAQLQFKADASRQPLPITPGKSKPETQAFDALRAAGKGKYEIAGTLLEIPGGGQVLQLKSYQPLK
jgi:copper chaperone CopZ